MKKILITILLVTTQLVVSYGQPFSGNCTTDCNMIPNGSFENYNGITGNFGFQILDFPTNYHPERNNGYIDCWATAANSPDIYKEYTNVPDGNIFLYLDATSNNKEAMVVQMQAPNTVKAGKRYVLSFFAQTSNRGQGEIELGLYNSTDNLFPNYDDFPGAISVSQTLSIQEIQQVGGLPEWKKYSFCFEANDNFDQLYILAGAYWPYQGFSEGGFHIDNVELYQLADAGENICGPGVIGNFNCDGNTNPDIQYTWSPVAGIAPSEIHNPSVYVNPAQSTLYTLTATYTDADGNTCSSSDHVLVSVDPTVMVRISPSDRGNLCDNSTISLTGTVSPEPITIGNGLPNSNPYRWEGPNGFTATTQTITVNVVGTYTFFYTQGCTVNTATYTIPPCCDSTSEVVAQITYTVPNCTQTIEFNSTTSQGDIYYWEWDFACGHRISSNGALGTTPISFSDTDGCNGTYVHTTGTFQNPIHDYSHMKDNSCNLTYPSLSDVQLVVKGSTGCISAHGIADLQLLGNPGTISISGGDNIYCFGEQITLTAVASASPNYDDMYTWDASALGTILSGQGTNIIEVLITSTTGGQVNVVGNNPCGNPASKNIVSQACCMDNGLSGLAKFSNNFPYTLNPINKDYYGGTVANTGCGATAITATPVQGSSTIDLHGNYYYTEGNQLKVLNESTCYMNTFLFMNSVTEPEYDKKNNTLWMISNGNLIEYTIPVGINPGQINTTYNLSGYTAVPGTSTIDANGRYYYYIAANVAVPYSSNGQVILATMIKVDLDNGSVHTVDIKELNAANPPQNTLTNFTAPRVVELEYTAGNRLIATVYHLVSELRPVMTEPGGNSGENPGVIHQFNNVPILDIDHTNNGMNNMEEVFFYRWDVMTISNNSNTIANSTIAGNRSVSFDNYSSSTYDPIENKYYLTADNGNTLYTADLDNPVTITAQSSVGVGTKGGTRYYEIEFANCGGGATAARHNNTLTNKTEIITSVQPNPNPNGMFTVSLIENNTTASADENVTIDVCDVIGRIIVRKENAGKETAIDISGYPQGVYYVKIYNANFVETQKLIYE